MCRALPIFLLVLLIASTSFAQDTTRLADWYHDFFEPHRSPVEAAIELSKQKVLRARQTNNAADAAHELTGLGLLYLTRAKDYDGATELFLEALAIEDSMDLSLERVYSYVALSQVFEDVGDYPQSELLLHEALEMPATEQDIPTLCLVLKELGEVNVMLGNLDVALDDFRQVLQYKEQLNRPEFEGDVLFSIGQVFTLQGKYGDALREHKAALAIRRELHNRVKEAASLNAVGELCRQTHDEKRGLANHMAALEIRKSLKDEKGLAESYNNLGSLYYTKKDYSQALQGTVQALSFARNANDAYQQQRACELLSQCYEAQGDFAKALEYRKLYQSLTDFITHDNNERSLLELQGRYALKKKQSRIDTLESERKERERVIERQRFFRNVLFVFIGLVSIIAVLLIYLYLLKKRSHGALEAVNNEIQQKNEALQDLNATKDKFFSIISHDLKGPLNSLTSFSSLLISHLDHLSKEDIQMLAKDLDKSVKNLFDLLENLLEWSRSQTGNIEFTPEAIDVQALINANIELLKAQAGAKKISLEGQASIPVMAYAHKNSVNTVVRNLLSNAIKFTPEGGRIVLGVTEKNREIEFLVKDNGVGMSADIVQHLFRLDTKHSTKGTANEKGTGLGLILCKEFIEKNGGRLWVTSEVGLGSTFYFTVPRNPQ